MLKQLKTNHGTLNLPAFFPEATLGFVREVPTEDLEKCKTDGVVTNTYHLLRLNLVSEIEKKRGFQNYMDFQRPVISDSGGFQVMSLIRNNGFGEIKDDKVVFKLNGEVTELTPEKCIEIQIRIGSDIVMCLDDCTHADENEEELKKSVERTINWAKRCKTEFVKLTENMENKPLLFAIIQGGENYKLREYCADELRKIGFDGYSFGGWPVNSDGLLKGILKYTAELIPDEFPKYAMGVGDPRSIIECFKMRYNIFDCVVPTREGRRRRLYYFKKNPSEIKNLDEDFFGFLSIKNQKYSEDNECVSEFCDCELCLNYSKKELREMFREKNPEALRLASIHNLRFYSQLMELLRRF